jgi:ribosome-binding protein aMBF1 (putative translation factor)
MKKQKISMIISKNKRKGYIPAIILQLADSSESVEVTDKQFKRVLKKGSVKDIYQRVGNNISELRRKKGLSVKQLAVKSGIKPPFLSNIENGKRKPTLYTMEKIARGLKVDIIDFIGMEVKNDGLTDKEFINTVLIKKGRLRYVKIKNK